MVDADARAFWDEHHHVNEDPSSWQADPQCREAINRRVSGEPQAWPLLAFKWYTGRRFRRGLSLGSGLGNLERAARQIDLVEEIEGIDASEVSLQIARLRAASEGLTGISYTVGNLNRISLPRAQYDVVFFHASLHHVRSIERLLAQVERSMTPDALLFLDEWVGPSRTQWTDARLARMRALYADLPEAWRAYPYLRAPIVADDPSEAARSSAILPAVRRMFHVMAERPYGGHLVAVILSQLAPDRVSTAERGALITRLLALEEADLAVDPSCSYHAVVVACRKTGVARTLAHTSNVAMRVGVAGYDVVNRATEFLIAAPIRRMRQTRLGRVLVGWLRPLKRWWRGQNPSQA
jgi:SAM-dependent methyltransferase